MYTVFAHSVFRTYRAPIFSLATVFYLLASALTFIPPLLITYRSQGFWLRHEVYREQPDVHFKHELLVRLDKADGSHLEWATYDNYNHFVGDAHLRVPLVKSRETDANRDGKLDRLDLRVEVPLRPEEAVVGARVMMFFDVKLHRFSSVHLEGLAVADGSGPGGLAGSGMQLLGDLVVKQRQPIANKGRDERFNYPIVDKTSVFAESYDLAKVLKEYHARNLTTRVENTYTTWFRGPTSSSSSVPGRTFSADLTLHYPEQDVTYRPGFWQTLKWGWVQYCSVLVVFVFVFRRIKTYVFSRQVLPTQPGMEPTKPHLH